jgi:Protein of unknown function (DUF3285)
VLNSTLIPLQFLIPMNPEVSTESVMPDADPALEASPALDPNAPPPGSYVKHAMRNMVRKRGKSLQHFFLSLVGLMALFVGLAYITR